MIPVSYLFYLTLLSNLSRKWIIFSLFVSPTKSLLFNHKDDFKMNEQKYVTKLERFFQVKGGIIREIECTSSKRHFFHVLP